MMPIIVVRVLESAAILAAFAVLAKFIGWYVRLKERPGISSLVLPNGVRVEDPTLLYFWGDGCAQCAPQERQIERARVTLQEAGKKFTILKLNALEEQTLASSMHILTVPTTVLLNADGKIAASNPGLTPWRTLVQQYQNLN
jgi:hypothetical protein